MADGAVAPDESVPPSHEEPVHDEGSNQAPDEFVDARIIDAAAQYTDAPDYYALLNLPRNPPPTDAQIRAAFRTLTLSFHPDKQPPEQREAAAQHYDRIRIAYETLSDPHARVVYDMLGEEGVHAEWGVGGSMGRSGEAEKTGMAVGVRAMDERQFRKWFLDTMRKRERRAVDALVQARGSIKVNLDARSLLSTGLNGEPKLQLPDVKLTSYALGYSFSTPFSPTRWLRQLVSDNTEEAAPTSIAPVDPDADDDEADDVLIINAGINGKPHELKRKIRLVDQETGNEFDREIKIGSVLIAESFKLGATWRHAVGPLPLKSAPTICQLGLSLLENSVLETTANVFPMPSVQTSIAKSITPIPGTKPFLVNLKTTYNRSLWECPPSVDLTVQRQVGPRDIAYMNWSSGVLFWPDFVINMIATPSEDSPVIVSHETSKIELGYTVVPPNQELLVEGLTAQNAKEDVHNYEARELAWETARCDPQTTYGFTLHSSPNMPLALSCTYARTLFARRADLPPHDRVLAEWTLEGYKPNRPLGPADILDTSGVRLEVSGMLRADDLSLGWWVDGTRRVTEHTKLGVGVGLQGGAGLTVHVVWRRLAQRVRVPVVLVPVENATVQLCVLAAAVPWAVYAVYEYAVRRPRQRRQWLRHARSERRRLERLVAGKREEAMRIVELMREQVGRRQERERGRDGLVIVSAEYGYFPAARSGRGRASPSVESERRDPIAIDVTTAVAALVDQGQLSISDNITKWHLTGFWDPAPLRPKQLRVRYQFQGQEHYVQVGDNEPLSCPMRTHLVA